MDRLNGESAACAVGAATKSCVPFLRTLVPTTRVRSRLVSAGHGAPVSRLRGLGRRHAAAAQAHIQVPPPSIRSAALPAVEPPRRSPRRIRDPAQELREEVRSGYRERAADAAERRSGRRAACLSRPSSSRYRGRATRRGREGSKGGAAEKRKGHGGGRGGPSPTNSPRNSCRPRPSRPNSERRKLPEPNLRRLRAGSWWRREELAVGARLRAALRRVTLAKEKG